MHEASVIQPGDRSPWSKLRAGGLDLNFRASDVVVGLLGCEHGERHRLDSL